MGPRVTSASDADVRDGFDSVGRELDQNDLGASGNAFGKVDFADQDAVGLAATQATGDAVAMDDAEYDGVIDCGDVHVRSSIRLA